MRNLDNNIPKNAKHAIFVLGCHGFYFTGGNSRTSHSDIVHPFPYQTHFTQKQLIQTVNSLVCRDLGPAPDWLWRHWLALAAWEVGKLLKRPNGIWLPFKEKKWKEQYRTSIVPKVVPNWHQWRWFCIMSKWTGFPWSDPKKHFLSPSRRLNAGHIFSSQLLVSSGLFEAMWRNFCLPSRARVAAWRKNASQSCRRNWYDYTYCVQQGGFLK